MQGLDLDSNGNPVIIKHTKPIESDLYLGRIPHETFIETVLKQFKNYDDHPEMFVVKRPANDNDESIDIDTDGYVTLDSDNFKSMNFGNGYKVCLVKRDSSGNIESTLDEVIGIVLGDFTNDGYVNPADIIEAKNFVSTGKNYTDVKIYNYLAAIVDRTNVYYNPSTIISLKNYVSNPNGSVGSLPNNFNYFDNDWSQFIQSSS